MHGGDATEEWSKNEQNACFRLVVGSSLRPEYVFFRTDSVAGGVEKSRKEEVNTSYFYWCTKWSSGSEELANNWPVIEKESSG